MNARMKNPIQVLDVNPVIQSLMGPIFQSGLPFELFGYLGLRVGELTSCELCINQAYARAEGNPAAQEHLSDVSNWQTSSVFAPAERAALELTDAITELADRYDSVSDTLWSSIEQHFNEKQRAALVLFISTMNMFARMNIATRRSIAD